MAREARYSVLSPQCRLTRADGQPARSGLLADRLDDLAGATIYLVDTGFGGSHDFMEQLQRWFTENMPGVETVRRRKPGNVFADDTDGLWEEIKAKGQGVVLGVGG